MTNEISALVDGELDDSQQAALCAALKRDDQLRRRCSEYRLIGEAMRREPHLNCDIAARVMQSVRAEPVVLAPRAVPRALSRHPVLALAATLAGVAVVGWVAFGPQGQGGSLPRSAEPVAIKRVPAMQGVQPVAQRDLRDYVAAHRARSGTLVSVYAEPLAGRKDIPPSGEATFGQINVHHRVIGDQVFVVMGEMPSASLRRIGDGMVPGQP